MNSVIGKTFTFLSLLLVLVIAVPTAFAQLDVTGDITGDDALEGERTDDDEGTVTVTNTDDTITLTKFVFTVDDPTEFSDGDETISITFSDDFLPNLTPSASGTLTVKVVIPDDIILDTYEGTITVTAENADATDPTITFNDTFKLRVDIRPEDVTDICEDGRVGLKNLNIDQIKNPDDGDDYKPLEEINIEVDVDNDDDDRMDVEFTAFLIDRHDDDVLEEVSTETEIDDEDDHDFDIDLTVPADIEDEGSDRYSIYVVANEENDEDKHCDWQKVDIEIDKDKDDVVADDFIIDEPLICGLFSEVRVKVVNIGNNNQDDITVRMVIPDLNIDLFSQEFDLDDDGDDKVIPFSLDIPKGTLSGSYAGRVEVRDEDGSIFTRSDESIEGFDFLLECSEPRVTASLNLAQTSFTSNVGSSVNTVATIINTGDNSQEFMLRLTPLGSWTDSIETSFTLDVGESRTEVLNLLVRLDGSHTATVEVLADGSVVSTQVITVQVGRESTISQESGSTTARVIGTTGNQLPLSIIIGILALAVIVLLIWLITLSMRSGNGNVRSNTRESVKKSRGR